MSRLAVNSAMSVGHFPNMEDLASRASLRLVSRRPAPPPAFRPALSRRVHCLLGLWWLFWLLVSAGRASAQAAPVDDQSVLSLEVRASPGAVDAERLRADLERELSMPVQLVAPGAAGARVIIELTEDGLLRLRVTRDDQPALTRETQATEDRERLTTTVSLLVSNLVRDESAELLALLRAEPAEPAAVETAAPLEAAETVEAVETAAPVEAAETVEAVETVAPAPEAPPALEPDRPEVPLGVDFIPGLGSSTVALGSEIRLFSFGALSGLSGGIRGLGLSSLVDVALGRVEGAQIGGLVSASESDVRGLQLGGLVAASAHGVHGLQLGGVGTFAAGPVHGVQLGGALTVAAGPLAGVQLSLVNVAAAEVAGMQLGLVNTAVAPLGGVQLGLVNVSAGDVDGVQLGLVNIATGRVRGLQLGLVNVAEHADASIGLVSAHGRGRTHLRAGADTNGFLNASLVHGGEVTHMIVSVGVEPFLTHASVALGLGVGARARLDDVVHLDFEVVSSVLLDEAMDQSGPDFLAEGRVLVGFRLADPLALYVGLAYRAHISPRGARELGAPILEHELASDPLIRAWPAILAGVELF